MPKHYLILIDPIVTSVLLAISDNHSYRPYSASPYV